MLFGSRMRSADTNSQQYINLWQIGSGIGINNGVGDGNSK